MENNESLEAPEKAEEKNLVVKRTVLDFVKNQGMQTSKEFINALQDEVKEIILAATERAEGNRRHTLMGKDL